MIVHTRSVAFCLVAILALPLQDVPAAAATTRVTAEGRAAGDAPNARAMALTDALREAVRLGAGVDVLSTTGVKDFVLQFDRVFETAFGYVRNYAILESGLGPDEIYRVKISAEVGEGTPGRQDVVALQQIVRLKKSPRVALRVDELIEGVPAGSGLATGWFEEQAKAMQLQLIDLGQAGFQNDKMAARDKLVGDDKTAAFREADLPQNVDFLIDVKVRGSHGGQDVVYGTTLNKFSLGADLRAVKADTGVVIASVALPTWEGLSQIATLDGAARDLVHRLLAGDTGAAEAPGAWALFRNILAQWVSELDLGAIYKIDFKGIQDAEFDALQDALKSNERISSVWSREFDSAGLSTLEVETRLEAQDLKKAMLAALGSSFKFDLGTAHHLQFVRAAPSSPIWIPETNAAPLPPPPVPSHGIPVSAWIGLALLVAGGATGWWIARARRQGKADDERRQAEQAAKEERERAEAKRAAEETRRRTDDLRRTEALAGGGPKPAHDVFISYARLDDTRVHEIVGRLKRLGARVWSDRDIDPGAKFTAELVRAIESSSTVIIFLSHQSVLRPYIQKEATLALSRNRNLLPVFLEQGVTLPPELELLLIDIQHLYIHDTSTDDAVLMIVSALKKLGLVLAPA